MNRFAGIFAWTTSSSRMLGATDDLPYLKAFGNCIMTELARLDASTSDKAKAKFISSISHELRCVALLVFLENIRVEVFQISIAWHSCWD